MAISKKSVIQDMTKLRIYKPEFNATIEIYVGLIKQYNKLVKQFEDSNYRVEEKTGYSDNSKKSPIVATIENLRKDILRYANELGLTPAGLKRINDKGLGGKKLSPLAEVLMHLEK